MTFKEKGGLTMTLIQNQLYRITFFNSLFDDLHIGKLHEGLESIQSILNQ
jgi:hypothetical protein